MIRRRPALLAPGLLAVPLLLSACGGGSSGASGVASLDDATEEASSDDSADASVDEEVDTEAMMLEFAQCMRDSGIDMEDPTIDADGRPVFGGFIGGGRPPGGQPGDGEDLPVDDFREAMDACGELLEGAQFGPGRGGPGGDLDLVELEDQMLEFAQCMRDNGVDMDDPDFSAAPGEPGEGGGPRGGLFMEADPDDPTFQAAMDACGDVLGGFGPGRGPLGAPPTGDGVDS